ncbi:hypothetical protein [Enemella evansiae]|uniref:hypothetical protein n=1 Tax=Enemella evansiae TaxID=2016499 RepID=UPI000B975764|nr:hypothetical protein [Enemella evansiae]OYN96742.1 hypothetical protein CGZ95_15735 [Enemella evansiae]TDO86252.1 hypothetical protein C8D81_3627 [Enemella evansiae]
MMTNDQERVLGMRFDRSDWFVLRVLPWLVAGLLAGGGPFAQVAALLTGRYPLEVPVLTGPAVEAGQAPGVSVHWSQQTWLIDPEPGLLAVLLIEPVLTLVALAVGVLLLDRLVRQLRAEPFAPRSARLLGLLGLLLMVWGAAAPMLRFGGSLFAQLQSRTDQVAEFSVAPFSLGGYLAPLVLGLLLVAIAYAFRRGQRLADDVAGLV